MTQASLQTGHQHTLLAQTRTRESPVKIGKVVSVHREDHSVDLVFLDGNVVTQVPVLTNGLGSNFGTVNMVAPSYDKDQLAKKTYPEASTNAVHSGTNTSKVGRDQYVWVLQAEGNFFGTAKMAVIGFMPPQVSEMLFARHEMGEDGVQSMSSERQGEFDDMLLHRHPSDMQTTLDKSGKLSVQNPNGSRITMGEDVGAVDLTKKDYDKLYELRENLDRAVSIYALAKDAAHKKRADILNSAGGIIHGVVYQANEQMRADLILTDGGTLVGTVYNPNGATMAYLSLTADGSFTGFGFNLVRLFDNGGDFIELSNGNVQIHAVSNMHITAGGNITIEAGANISVDAGANIDITAGGILTEVATLIELN